MGKNKILAVLSSTAMGVLLTTALATTVQAADRDFYDVRNKVVYEAADWRNLKDTTKFNELIGEITDRPEDFVYEFKGHAYDYSKLTEKIMNEKNENNTYTDAFMKAIKDTDLQQEIPSFKEDKLAIESISAINKTTISVTFTGEGAPAEAKEVTLKTPLVDGQTEVTFEFDGKEYTATLDKAFIDTEIAATNAVVKAEESLLEADLVEARKVVKELPDTDAKVLLNARLDSLQLKLNKIVEDVNVAAKADNQVTLDKLLSLKPFTGYNVDKIADYLKAIKTANPQASKIAEIQKLIDGVNTTAENKEIEDLVDVAKTAMTVLTENPNGDDHKDPATSNIEVAQKAIDELPEMLPQAVAKTKSVEVDYKAKAQEKINEMKVVAPVLDAKTNQIKLLAALQNPEFVCVNPDLITNYTGVSGITAKTVKEIQTVIDTANKNAATTAVTTAEGSLKATDVAKAQALVNNLPEDVAPAKDKTTLQGKLDVVNALIAVADAETEPELLAALQNKVLGLTDVNPAAIADYKLLVDGADKVEAAVIKIAKNVQDNVITAGNTAALEKAFNAIKENFPKYDETKAEDQAKALKELNRLAEVTEDVDAKTIDAELIEKYITDIKAGLADVATITDATGVQAAITKVNNDKEANARLAAVNAATNASEMRTALTAVAIAEKTTAYINLSSQDKLEVAELVLVARNKIEAAEGVKAKEFANTKAVTDAITTESTGAIAVRATFIKNVNDATNINGMNTALDNDVFPEFKALGSLEKVEKAELVYNKLAELKVKDPVEKFETIAEIKTAAGL